MDPEPGEFRDFPEPATLINDDAAHPFSSPRHAQTVNRPLTDLPGGFDSSFESAQSIESDIDMTKILSNNNIKTNLIDNDNKAQEHLFDNERNQENIFSIEELLTNIKSFHTNEFDLIIKNLNQKFKYLEIECERAQRITTHFQNQLIAVKNIAEKLSLFCTACRSLIVSALNIRQNPSNLTYQQLEILTTYAPDSDLITPNIAHTLLDQKSSSSSSNRVDDYKHRLEYARLIINLLKQTIKLRLQIGTLNELLIKSVLSKNERFNEIEQSLRLPSNLFNDNPLYERFLYEITTTTINKQDVYIRCIRGQLTQNDIHVGCTENAKHLLSQINYNASEKYSFIYDIEFKRAITSIDQLTIAVPCFPLPSELQSTNSTYRSEQLQQQQQIYIRCKRIMDPLIHIPAIIETYHDVSYAVFRITQSLSAISVEAVLFYPFQILRTSRDGLYSVYTSEHSSIFRIETPQNTFIRSPRVRIIPMNSELIGCITGLQREDQLLSSSDLIEFDWYKETKTEGIISLTIELTRSFNLINETNEDLQKRRRKAQKKLTFQRQKFEQEKYDEAGGSLAATPTSNYGLTSPTVMSHLPSIAGIIERALTDHQESHNKSSLNINLPGNSQSISSMKAPLKWKLDGFKNANAPIILLGYKNRKWKNYTNLATITPTANKDTFIISLTSLLDRIILLRCWSESNNDGKFDKLAENLWSLTSMKLFCCVLARDPSSINTRGHYALVIVPIQKQNLAEDILRKRNYTEYIYDEQFLSNSQSKTQLSKIIPYQSHHTLLNRSSLPTTEKYLQFCLAEGTYVRIVPMGNIDVHEKVELSFRLHAQYPVVMEFDIYPIDIYRQKTDQDFIGTLNIYQINTRNMTIGSTSSTLTATAVSSRTSSGSKDFELVDGLPSNSSARTSISGPESISNNGGTISRSGFERLTARDLNETNLICSIRIRLPKAAFNLPSIQSNTIPMTVPDFFTNVIQSLSEGKREFAEALTIHPALMNPLLSSLALQQGENDSQLSTSSDGNSKTNLRKDGNNNQEQRKLEDQTLLKWLKRQNAFKTNQTIDYIISALIHIGRVDLAYTFKIDNLRNQCQSLE